MTDKGYQLSIIVPTFNERDNIEELVSRLQACLQSIRWELIVVDDNSPDGTADIVRSLHKDHAYIRCIQRIGRRGLSSACIEGFLASSAPYIGVIDADLQHDELLLPAMLQSLQSDSELQLVIGSRFMHKASTGDLAPKRVMLSRVSNWLGNKITKAELSDPMSGFFMVRRACLMELLPRLSQIGFKILLDIFTSSKGAIRYLETPYRMRQRFSGDSKLDIMIALEYLQLLLDKSIGRLIPTRFIFFVMVGLTGLGVHLFSLYALITFAQFSFNQAQVVATVIAIANNFYWNNLFTYRDRRLHGSAFFKGMVVFYLACSFGVLINVNIASALNQALLPWWFAGTMGAVIGSIWNFAMTNYFTWQQKLPN